MSEDNLPRPKTRAEAIALGVGKYFPDKPCRRGHVPERYVYGGHCITCLTNQMKRTRARITATKREAILSVRPDEIAAIPLISRAEARAAGLLKYFTGEPCKQNLHYSERLVSSKACCACVPEIMKRHRERHPGISTVYSYRWREKNLPKFLAYAAEYRTKHKKHLANLRAIWGKKNPHALRMGSARYNAAKLKASPPWLTKEHWRQIEAVYEAAQIKQAQTGIPQHVDHIVPIKGKLVCGLHVPWNLQVLTRSENSRKRNKFIPG